jgi:ring-1,2-phenylacetyl-CoA epoxidase subunit PaaE
MMDNALAVLQSRKIPESKIHIEYFSAPTNTTTEASKVKLAPSATAIIIKDGDEYAVHISEGESILDAAIRSGLDAPYSCQSGTCATCRAKLVEGEVNMKTSFALNAEDKKRGFILTCQARAVSDHLVVNYDDAM